MEEIWKDIPNFDGLYMASNLGKIKRLPRKIWNGKSFYLTKETITYGRKTPKGYMSIEISKPNDDKRYLFQVHRLIALSFIDNPKNLPQINHINGVKDDNRLENLEWCDRKYNNNYGTHNSNIAKSHSKPIIQYTLNGEFVREWESATVASRELEFPQSAINWCCLKKKKFNSCKGFLWKYKDDETPISFKNGKAIFKIDKNGNILDEYNNITEASKENNILITSITNCLKGRSKTAGGFGWIYK